MKVRILITVSVFMFLLCNCKGTNTRAKPEITGNIPQPKKCIITDTLLLSPEQFLKEVNDEEISLTYFKSILPNRPKKFVGYAEGAFGSVYNYENEIDDPQRKFRPDSFMVSVIKANGNELFRVKVQSLGFEGSNHIVPSKDGDYLLHDEFRDEGLVYRYSTDGTSLLVVNRSETLGSGFYWNEKQQYALIKYEDSEVLKTGMKTILERNRPDGEVVWKCEIPDVGGWSELYVVEDHPYVVFSSWMAPDSTRIGPEQGYDRTVTVINTENGAVILHEKNLANTREFMFTTIDGVPALIAYGWNNYYIFNLQNKSIVDKSTAKFPRDFAILSIEYSDGDVTGTAYNMKKSGYVNGKYVYGEIVVFQTQTDNMTIDIMATDLHDRAILKKTNAGVFIYLFDSVRSTLEKLQIEFSE